MTIPKNTGMLLLAAYLILTGLLTIANLNLGQASIVMPILAMASGVLIILGK